MNMSDTLNYLNILPRTNDILIPTIRYDPKIVMNNIRNSLSNNIVAKLLADNILNSVIDKTVNDALSLQYAKYNFINQFNYFVNTYHVSPEVLNIELNRPLDRNSILNQFYYKFGLYLPRVFEAQYMDMIGNNPYYQKVIVDNKPIKCEIPFKVPKEEKSKPQMSEEQKQHLQEVKEMLFNSNCNGFDNTKKQYSEEVINKTEKEFRNKLSEAKAIDETYSEDEVDKIKNLYAAFVNGDEISEKDLIYLDKKYKNAQAIMLASALLKNINKHRYFIPDAAEISPYVLFDAALILAKSVDMLISHMTNSAEKEIALGLLDDFTDQPRRLIEAFGQVTLIDRNGFVPSVTDLMQVTKNGKQITEDKPYKNRHYRLKNVKSETDFILHTRINDLYLYISSLISKFPNHYKKTLGEKIEGSLIKMSELCIEFAESKELEDKVRISDELDTTLKKMVNGLNLAYNKRLFANQRLLFITTKSDEIGRIIGGVKKSINKQVDKMKKANDSNYRERDANGMVKEPFNNLPRR